jgi:hypothetical protein
MAFLPADYRQGAKEMQMAAPPARLQIEIGYASFIF